MRLAFRNRIGLNGTECLMKQKLIISTLLNNTLDSLLDMIYAYRIILICSLLMLCTGCNIDIDKLPRIDPPIIDLSEENPVGEFKIDPKLCSLIGFKINKGEEKYFKNADKEGMLYTDNDSQTYAVKLMMKDGTFEGLDFKFMILRSLGDGKYSIKLNNDSTIPFPSTVDIIVRGVSGFGAVVVTIK